MQMLCIECCSLLSGDQTSFIITPPVPDRQAGRQTERDNMQFFNLVVEGDRVEYFPAKWEANNATVHGIENFVTF